jgi:hypothetical protein
VFKSLLENGPKATALLSFCVLMLTVLHDWGYFWIIGSKFQSIQTPYDYIANSITWLPLSLGLITLYLVATRLTLMIGRRSRDDFKSTPHRLIQETQNRQYTRVAVLGFVATLLCGSFWYVFRFPVGVLFGTFTIVTGYCSILCVWLRFANFRQSPDLTLVIMILSGFVPLIAGMSFAGGVVEAIDALSSFNKNVYGLKQKDVPDRHVLLLRSLDKGVLTYDLASSQIAFTRWDSLIGIDHATIPILSHRGFCGATEHICSPPEAP